MASSEHKTFKQKERQITQKHLVSDFQPKTVMWKVDEPNQISSTTGQLTVGSCLRCINPPCMNLSEDEIKLNTLSNFPSDKNTTVCPTGAIQWLYEDQSPKINESICIGCGLCAARCPSYAIYSKSTGVATINDDVNEAFITNETQKDSSKTEQSISTLRDIPSSNLQLHESDSVLSTIYTRIKETNSLNGNSPDLLIRNLLLTLKTKAGIRRPGDTNIRMDLILENKNDPCIGIGEIEFGSDTLNTPRNILDDIAVASSRYKIKKILPLIFLLELPNQRSEYWQVLKDIKEVLKIEIHTVTLGVLLLLLWNRVKSDSLMNFFYNSDINASTRDVLERVLRREINLSERLLGIIEPMK